MKPAHKTFVREYSKSSNATQSYMKAYPDSSYQGAASNANRLLKKDKVISAIDRAEDRKDVLDLGSREFLLNEAHEAGLAATADGQHRTRLAAVDVKAKLSGAYNQDAPDLEGYRDLIQNLTINVTASTPEPSEDGVIDVSASGERGRGED